MFVTNPLIIGTIILTIAFLAASLVGVDRDRPVPRSGDRRSRRLRRIRRDRSSSGRPHLLDPRPTDFLLPTRCATPGLTRIGLLMAIGAYLLVFVPLYTSMFTNMAGLRSSTIDTDGTLLYWLGQHDYRRGEQPLVTTSCCCSRNTNTLQPRSAPCSCVVALPPCRRRSAGLVGRPAALLSSFPFSLVFAGLRRFVVRR